MIISQTPLRISFAGGGTDFKRYYTIGGGKVVSTAIDKFVKVIIQERFDDLIVVSYSKTEVVHSVEDIKHDLVREALLMTGIKKGIEIKTMSDVSSEGSGLGSSSAITVGLLNAFFTYQNKNVSSDDLARLACIIEIDYLENPIGKQDQYIAAHGGIAAIDFARSGEVSVEQIPLSESDRSLLSENLMLFYTGMTRKSSEVLSDQSAKIVDNIDVLNQMKDQAQLLHSSLNNGNINAVGEALRDGWELKKKLSDKISVNILESLIGEAMNGGATGAKIAGAGGGGFLLLYVPPENRRSVREALKELKELPITIGQDGSKIIFNSRRR